MNHEPAQAIAGPRSTAMLLSLPSESVSAARVAVQQLRHKNPTAANRRWTRTIWRRKGNALGTAAHGTRHRL